MERARVSGVPFSHIIVELSEVAGMDCGRAGFS